MPLAFAAALAGVACADPVSGPPLAQVDLGPSLDAGRGDPLLLTFAATRARSRYLVDQGYTLAWDADDVPAFTTQDAGDLGVVLEVDGYLYTSDDDFLAPLTVTHTASDSAVLHFDLDTQLSGEIWFTAGTSSAATLDVRLVSVAPYLRHVSILPWLRRCSAPFTGVAASSDGITARHAVAPDPRLVAAGPGTFVTDFADALSADGPPTLLLGAASCGSTSGALDDLGTMINRASPPPATAAQLALRIDHDIPPYSSIEVRAHRAVVDAAAADTLAAAVQAAKAISPAEVLTAGRARLAGIPPLPGLSREDALAYRSSFTLLDQVTMPAEGKLGHDYYVFSRAPTWWSARLGQDVHESLAMILLARLDPAEATATQRNFIDRVEPDGYLPFTIGPVLDQTAGHTAAAPLFSFESWEIARLAQDPAFVADAYAAGVKLHGFWTTQRDQDHDGLCEWGGLTESLRSQGNVIWTEVAPPDQVEAVDLNSMLVMEEKALAAMASSLGKPDEAALWQAAAAARGLGAHQRDHVGRRDGVLLRGVARPPHVHLRGQRRPEAHGGSRPPAALGGHRARRPAPGPARQPRGSDAVPAHLRGGEPRRRRSVLPARRDGLLHVERAGVGAVAVARGEGAPRVRGDGAGGRDHPADRGGGADRAGRSHQLRGSTTRTTRRRRTLRCPTTCGARWRR